jgi:hypothetical protein
VMKKFYAALLLVTQKHSKTTKALDLASLSR